PRCREGGRSLPGLLCVLVGGLVRLRRTAVGPGGVLLVGEGGRHGRRVERGERQLLAGLGEGAGRCGGPALVREAALQLEHHGVAAVVLLPDLEDPGSLAWPGRGLHLRADRGDGTGVGAERDRRAPHLGAGAVAGDEAVLLPGRHRARERLAGQLVLRHHQRVVVRALRLVAGDRVLQPGQAAGGPDGLVAAGLWAAVGVQVLGVLGEPASVEGPAIGYVGALRQLAEQLHAVPHQPPGGQHLAVQFTVDLAADRLASAVVERLVVTRHQLVQGPVEDRVRGRAGGRPHGGVLGLPRRACAVAAFRWIYPGEQGREVGVLGRALARSPVRG